jgi:hypothetical protein
MDILAAIASAIADLGLGVAGSAVYDFLKRRFAGRSAVSEAELQSAIGDFLVIHGVNAQAATVMNLLAERGVLQVTASNLYANESLTMRASSGAIFSVGHGTTTRTAKTAIQADAGAFVTGSGGAVVQNADGSVSFLVGSRQGDGIRICVDPARSGGVRVLVKK